MGWGQRALVGGVLILAGLLLAQRFILQPFGELRAANDAVQAQIAATGTASSIQVRAANTVAVGTQAAQATQSRATMDASNTRAMQTLGAVYVAYTAEAVKANATATAALMAQP